MRYLRLAPFLAILMATALLAAACTVDPPSPAVTLEPGAAAEEEMESIPAVTLARETLPEETETETETAAGGDINTSLAPPIKLKDQFGEEHDLKDYIGKVVLLNFWASWCGPCQIEMPDIQAAYEKYGKNEGDVIILGVASPYSEENSFTMEGTAEDVINFLAEYEYTYPSLLDESGKTFAMYGIYSIPQTYMISKDGSVLGVKPGLVTAEDIDKLIEMTLEEDG